MKQILDGTLIFLGILGLAVISLFCVYKATDETLTMTTVYATAFDVDNSTIIEDSDEEKTYIIEANYFSNSDNSGMEVQELKFNYYTDYEFNELYSTGMQYIGDFSDNFDYSADFGFWGGYTSMNNYLDIIDTLQYMYEDDFIFYESYEDASWEAMSKLDYDTMLIINIGGEPYGLVLDKTVTYDVSSWLGSDTYEINLTYFDLFETVFNSIASFSKSYGEYAVPFKLSDFFTVYSFNDGKFDTIASTDITDIYIEVEFNYYEYGLVGSTQSLFEIVDCNSQYGEENIVDDYWNVENKYTFTTDNFSYRYSQLNDGYYITLNAETMYLIENSYSTYTILYIDLNNSDYNILGFDYYALANINVNEIIIIGNNAEFAFLSNSLTNSSVVQISYSATITITFATDSGKTIDMGVSII